MWRGQGTGGPQGEGKDGCARGFSVSLSPGRRSGGIHTKLVSDALVLEGMIRGLSLFCGVSCYLVFYDEHVFIQ